MKKIIALIALLLALCCSFNATFAEVALLKNGIAEEAKLGIVKNYFLAINDGEWENWVNNFYAPSLRADWLNFVGSEYNRENHIGILALKNVEVVEIVETECDYVGFYEELRPYYEDGLYECYEVTIDATVHVDNGYYHNGTSKHKVILVYENNNWWVGQTHVDNSALQTKNFWDFADYINKPSTIKVQHRDTDVIGTYDFEDYIFQGVCNEIGNMGFTQDAIKATVMAVKMIGWWAVAKANSSSKGYDLPRNHVTITGSNAASSEGKASVKKAMNNVARYCVISSTATGGKLFSIGTSTGSYSTSNKGCGQVMQKGAEYLSQNGYTWQEILHYYLDNSTYNTESSVGVVQIKNYCPTHSYGSYKHDTNGHWRVCSNCEYASSSIAHTWTTDQGTRVCSVCGRRESLTALDSIHVLIEIHSKEN